MSRNEERIARWRARREAEKASRAAHPDLPTEYAVLASRAEELAKGENEEAEPLLALVLESLRNLPSQSVADRRRIFDAVAQGLERGFEQADPHSDYAELRRRQLRAIVRVIEGEARSGVDVTQQHYRPADLDDAIEPLLTGYRRRRKRSEEAAHSRLRRQAVLADEAYAITVPADEEADLLYLRETLARIDAGRGMRPSHQVHPHLNAMKALLHYQFALLRSESRLALLWMLLGPALLIAILSAAYFLIGTHTILNMDVPTFSMIGTTTWFMLRNIIFRTTASFRGKRALHNFRPISPAMTGVTEGVIYMSSYTAVFTALIGGGHLLGLFTLPHNLAGMAFWIICVGLAGLAIGTVFGSIAAVWPFFPRVGPVIERSMMVVSGVFLVSEQLPTDYRSFVLWSPFSHAMQMLRSAYFESYKSEDADPEYYFVCLGLMIILAVIAQHSVRSRSNPA